MNRILKITGIVLASIATLVILSFVLLATFVNPNRFKPLLTDQVKKYTGRNLTIDGDLSWTLFPTLGVKVGHLALSNSPEFNQKIFAEIQGATVSVKLLPLLHSRVESSGITLNGLKLYLIKNADGKTDWQDFQSTEKSTDTNEPTPAPMSTVKSAALGLAVSGIDIGDAMISWDDEQAKQHMTVQQFQLHAKKINLTMPFSMEVSGNFDGNAPAMSGNFLLKTQISLNPQKQIGILDSLDLTTNIKQGAKKFDVHIQGTAAADLARNKLQLDNFVAQIANLKVSGRINIASFSTSPKLTGHLEIEPFDAKKWLQTTGQDIATLDNLKNLSGIFDFTAGTSLQSVTLQGIAKADEFQASKVQVSNINLQTNMQKGVLNLSPITAVFYKGTVSAFATANLNSAAPQISLQTKLVNFQSEPLLNDLSPKEKIKLAGAGNMDLQITTSGSDGDALVKHLNGTAHLSFNNGVLKGIDIGYLLDTARGYLSKQSTSRTDTNQTPFGTLTASATIHNGVIANNDLYLNANDFDTKGTGTINLVAQKINYELSTTAKQAANKENNLQNLYGIAIPISISGDLNNPSIQLDTQALMKAIAQQQLEKAKTEVRQKIQNQLKDKIPGGAGALINNLLGQ